MIYILARTAIGDIGDLVKKCAHVTIRIDLKFEMVYHPECTTHLLIGIIRSLRVTPIACGLEAPKRHRKIRLFIHLFLEAPKRHRKIRLFIHLFLSYLSTRSY